jgi:FlaA1/EpsC-like NDP-sugar epimerase
MTRQLSRASRHCLSRPHLLNSVAELLIFISAAVGAFLLRFDFSIPQPYVRDLLIAAPLWVVVKFIVFHLNGLHRRWWRFFSVGDAVRLGIANVVGSVVALVPIFILVPQGFPRSVPIVDFFLCLAGSAWVFLARRAIREALASGDKGEGRLTIIYGAGTAGVILLRELRANRGMGYTVCGFVDDNPAMTGMFVQDVRVLGRGSELPAAIAKTGADEVLIAIPSASGDQMIAILNFCQAAGVRFRTVCSLSELIEGKGLAVQIRQVDVQDLLCRTPARLDHFEIQGKIADQVVLVTGAAGSIGSELCFQLARFRPAAIVGFDIGETALFYLERAMAERFPDVRFHAEIGSVQSPRRMAEILKHYRPSILFHTAAYKHVPLMESSIFEAIDNNVFGTWNVALAAREHGVADFVLISSDKAVRPTSLMGATKRLCELMILSLRDESTRYVAVRFGNVLGSNGSVIPLFKSQIAAGGPVTVTHPEMRRYFMTISEAAQLVLQASAMGRGGEIFVLDMGQPLKIVDLAKNLISLSGLRPEDDIKIEFTGTRPGEKLFEELNFFDEETVPTHHEKIKIFMGNGVPDGDMADHLATLKVFCENGDKRGVVLFLKDMLPEYNPSAHILRQSMALVGRETGTGKAVALGSLTAKAAASGMST